MHGPTSIEYDSDICNYGSELQFLTNTNTTVKQSASFLTIMTNPATGRDLYSSWNGTIHTRKTSLQRNSDRISS